MLVDGDRCGWGASGRNGGFVEASLSHGLENGLSRWPNEIDTLVRLGRENFTAIRNTLGGRGIDAAWEETGVIERRHPRARARLAGRGSRVAGARGGGALLDREPCGPR